jgi:hypothetical protein
MLCATTAGESESVRGGGEGFSKNESIQKLYALGTYPDEGAHNPLTVNNPSAPPQHT